MMNLSVALVNNDQRVLHLLLLTKLLATTNRLLHRAPLAMLYCLDRPLSSKVSHHLPYLTTPYGKNGQSVSEENEVIGTWKEHFEGLFQVADGPYQYFLCGEVTPEDDREIIRGVESRCAKAEDEDRTWHLWNST